MVSIVRQNLFYWTVSVINDPENWVAAVAVWHPADFVVVPLSPQILRSLVHHSGHHRLSLHRDREIAVAGLNLQLVAEIPPVAHSVEPWQDQIQNWQKPLVRRTIARQLVGQGFHSHGWHRRSLQEKGLGVKG